MVMNGIDTLKGIFDQFNEQYAEKGWKSKQLAWESLRYTCTVKTVLQQSTMSPDFALWYNVLETLTKT